MINALPGMKPFCSADPELLLGETKDDGRWLVRTGLGSGDDLVKIDSEKRRCRSEEVIVDVGEDRELVARVQFFECVDGVGKGLPTKR